MITKISRDQSKIHKGWDLEFLGCRFPEVVPLRQVLLRAVLFLLVFSLDPAVV